MGPQDHGTRPSASGRCGAVSEDFPVGSFCRGLGLFRSFDLHINKPRINA